MESPGSVYRVAAGLTATLAMMLAAAPAMASAAGTPQVQSASYVVESNHSLDWTVTVTGLTPGDYIGFGAGAPPPPPRLTF